MMLYIVLFFGLTVFADFSVNVKADENVLEWPTQFHVQATQFSFFHNSVKTFEIWKTPKQSRTDINNGYTKVIVDTIEDSFGVKYYIREEATPGQGVETLCFFIKGSKDQQLKPENILPSAFDFEIVGQENVDNITCTKFKKVIHIPGIYSQSTIWAVYAYDGWIPIRYKILEMDLAGTTKDEWWYFKEFEFDINSNEVFSTDEYNCTAPASASDAVTKPVFYEDSKKDNHVKHAVKKFKRNYLDNLEHSQRKSINKNTKRRNLGDKLGNNQFSDRTPEEITTRLYQHIPM